MPRAKTFRHAGEPATGIAGTVAASNGFGLDGHAGMTFATFYLNARRDLGDTFQFCQ